MVTVSSFMFVSVSFLIWSAIWGRGMARGRVLWAGACPGGRVVGVHGDHCLAAAASPDLVRWGGALFLYTPGSTSTPTVRGTACRPGPVAVVEPGAEAGYVLGGFDEDQLAGLEDFEHRSSYSA